MDNFEKLMNLDLSSDDVLPHGLPKTQAISSKGFGDPEIKDMLAKVDLLSIIKADTGEQGHESGERIDFNACPVCGHRDCFSYYPATNSWSCFGASNQTGYAGGTALEYFKATRHCDDVEAVKWLREETGHSYGERCQNTSKSIIRLGHVKGSMSRNDSEEESDELRLPLWKTIQATNPPKRNPPLVHGVVRRGHVMLIGGKGKGSKTWTAIELSVAVAVGGKWFGFDCEKGRVLYIDPEMDQKSLDGRFHDVAEALYGHVPAEVDGIAKWCLRGALTSRGKAPTIEDLSHDIEARCSLGDFALVVIDSASCYIDGDENSAGDVRRFFAYVLRIAETTGATVLVVHHMGKGAKGGWDSIERTRGSSVWGDAPDAPLSLIEIFPKCGETSDYLPDGARAFALEDSGLREFPGIGSRHVIFDCPIHYVDEDGFTDGWMAKGAESEGGNSTAKINRLKREKRARDCEVALLAELLMMENPDEGIPAKKAAEIASEAVGETVNAQTLKTYIKASEHLEVYQKSKQRWLVVPK